MSVKRLLVVGLSNALIVNGILIIAEIRPDLTNPLHWLLSGLTATLLISVDRYLNRRGGNNEDDS